MTRKAGCAGPPKLRNRLNQKINQQAKLKNVESNIQTAHEYLEATAASFPAHPTRTPAAALAKPVRVGAFLEARSQDKAGEHFATFNVSMSNVLHSWLVLESVRDTVAALFDRSASPDGRTPGVLNLTSTITKFSVQTSASRWAWKIDAEVALNLRITDTAGHMVYSATYQSHARHPTAVWPTECLIEKTRNEALQQLLANIQADPVWQTLRQSDQP